MAIVRSRSGKFYDVPDEELSKYEVADGLLEAIAAHGAPPLTESANEEGEGQRGKVDPYGFNITLGFGGRRRRRWRNCWQNCWRNCY